ncbi:helix-turn-helix transcriptional regulator [Edwardsiella piscicida]
MTAVQDRFAHQSPPADTDRRVTLVMDCDRFFYDGLAQHIISDDRILHETRYAHLADAIATRRVDHVIAELYTHDDTPIDALLALMRVRAYRPSLRITVMTDITHPAVLAAVHSLGQVSLISKREPLPRLAEAYRHSLRQAHLSPRMKRKMQVQPEMAGMSFPEWKVVAIRSRGGDNYQVASYLGIHHKSVNYRQRCIMQKLAFASKPEFLRFLSAMSDNPVHAPRLQRHQQHVGMGAVDQCPRRAEQALDEAFAVVAADQ